MSEENKSKLIELAKEACKITWENQDTEGKIKRIVEDAVPFLLHKLGIQEKDDQTQTDTTETNSSCSREQVMRLKKLQTK